MNAESRNATLYAHDKEYVWRHPAALEGLALTVKDVFEFRDGMTIRADGADGEWLIDCALPDEFGVWFAAAAQPDPAALPSGEKKPQ